MKNFLLTGIFINIFLFCIGSNAYYAKLEYKKEICYLNEIPGGNYFFVGWDFVNLVTPEDQIQIIFLLSSTQYILFFMGIIFNKKSVNSIENYRANMAVMKIYKPDGKTLEETLPIKNGSFTLTGDRAGGSGLYKVCIKGMGRYYGDKTSLHLQVNFVFPETGASSLASIEAQKAKSAKPSNVAGEEDLATLEMRLSNINRKAEEIVKFQEYNSKRAGQYQSKQESVNSKVIWFTIGQAVLVLLVGVWQIWNLRKFFVRKHIY